MSSQGKFVPFYHLPKDIKTKLLINMLKKEIREEKTHMRYQKIKDWFSKWDRSIAALTALVVFCILLTFVIINIRISENDESESNEKSSRITRNQILAQDGLRCQVVGSPSDGINCSGLSVENLCTAINDVSTTTQVTLNQLTLSDIKFKDDHIEQGFLNCTTNLAFTALTLEGCLVENVSAKAFSGTPFASLKTLTISNSIYNFRRDIFEGTRLSTIQIRCSGSAIFEENVFGAVSRTLDTLQIQGCIEQIDKTEELTKITGSSEKLTALQILDLSSPASLRKIGKSNFQSTTALISLYLSNSNIEEIEAGAFDRLYLKLLDLKDNQLKTLPNGIFHDVKGGIDITGNKWRCDCDLVWLKKMFLRQAELFPLSSFSCYSDENVKEDFRDVIFCPNGTTDSPSTPSAPASITTASSSTTSTKTIVTTTTTKPTTTTTPTTPPDVPASFDIVCKKPLNSQVEGLTIPNNILTVRNDSVTIEFYLKDTSIYIVRITGDLNNDNLLWFNSNNKDENGCIKDIKNNSDIEVEPLHYNQSYVFCVMLENYDTVSPFDCSALTVSENDGSTKMWLTQDDMVPFICGICGSLILISLVSGLIVFYCIRQHPSLIKGNPRVIIVESEATDAIVMPSTYYDEIRYKPPSMNSYSNGYLTPRHYRGYTPPPRPPSRLRTISESSDFAVASTSSGGRLRKNPYKKRSRLEQVVTTIDEHMYEPPPLPPNHPSGMLYNDSQIATYSRV